MLCGITSPSSRVCRVTNRYVVKVLTGRYHGAVVALSPPMLVLFDHLGGARLGLNPLGLVAAERLAPVEQIGGSPLSLLLHAASHDSTTETTSKTERLLIQRQTDYKWV